MGDMADYYRDIGQEFEQEFHERRRNERDKKETEFIWWKSNAGNIRATEMDVYHLRNCINKIEQQGWRTEWLPKLKELLELKSSRWDTSAKAPCPFKRRT
ncbi:MAG: hypothetical protein KUG81_02435 [Gammaproteobacteria bacterium]|nr:hypothetical protein [Gammaproteobacteria bacterium]